VVRFQQQGGQRFGAGHLIDVLRGKHTDKVTQYGHRALSTYGIGAELSEAQWRAVLRQLLATGSLRTESEYNTLALTDSARAVLRGEVPVRLRRPAAGAAAAPSGRRARDRGARGGDLAGMRSKSAPRPPDAAGLARFLALKAWRAGIAREHNLPAYVIFHDATLAEMAEQAPDSLVALERINGVGKKKLEAYGAELLQLLRNQP
jgi:ATP-dependent DNA helicase RecQ